MMSAGGLNNHPSQKAILTFTANMRADGRALQKPVDTSNIAVAKHVGMSSCDVGNSASEGEQVAADLGVSGMVMTGS